MRSGRDFRVGQISVALAIPALAVLMYSGPLSNAVAEQSTTNEYFVVAWGAEVAVLAAVMAVLGAIATARPSRVEADVVLGASAS